jgi:hypothetical protein
MSAAEIIEQIKALPPEERREVSQFVLEHIDSKQDSSAEPPQAAAVRYATDEQAHAAGVAVVAEFPETFRRLAE